MALNEFDNKRQYTKYKRHVNESHERIDAATVNKLQDDLSVQQQETNSIKDTAFEERVYTIFNNNHYANAMFVDFFKTGEYINLHESTNIAVNNSMTQISIKNATEGIIVSTPIYSSHGSDIELNDFFLITNDYIPVGAEIKYYLEIHTGERWPITPNALKLPLHLSDNIKYGFKIVTHMKANALGESPILNGYAILYWDAQVEVNYGMTNPDLQRFPKISIGEDDGLTVIVKDRAQDDKVVKILEPLNTVDLTYDYENNEGRLVVAKTYWPDYEGVEVTQTHELIYQEYLNSDNKIDTVLYGVRQTTSAENERR